MPEIPTEEGGSENEGDDPDQQEREDRDDDDDDGGQKTGGAGVGVGATVAMAVVMEDRTRSEEEGLEGSAEKSSSSTARRSHKSQRRINETVIVPLTKSVGSHEQLVEVEVQTVRRLRACPELAGNCYHCLGVNIPSRMPSHTSSYILSYTPSLTSYHTTYLQYIRPPITLSSLPSHTPSHPLL